MTLNHRVGAIALISLASLTACSAAMKTGHGYAKSEGDKYFYSMNRTDEQKAQGVQESFVTIRYLGVKDGVHSIAVDEPADMIMSCPVSCEKTREYAPGGEAAAKEAPFNIKEIGSMALDDAWTGKLTASPSAQAEVAKASASPAGGPPA